ncbi:hypothetical protein EXU48_22910 [Occultella glacieicola]|uniref:Uncharacterized protein n=1 Tax=Occultella glacieicola TaxID=2518684 RepID=A0ABY2E0J5_9MICO|nr:hypothetical protein [Occultella glacieicola]TDE88576.1 hypothetical protein EXU48_22910 [Occultella glacieicola]
MSYQSQGQNGSDGSGGGYPGGYGAPQNPNPYGGASGAYGAPQNPNPYGGSSGAYGAPQNPSPYGGPDASSPYTTPASGGYGVPAGGYAGAGAYGTPGGYGAHPPPKRSNTGLIVGLAVGGAVLLFLIVGVLANLGGRGDYGSDPHLDRLHDQCEAGDYAACDDLYFESPVGSEYEEFGDTCGGRTDGGTLCEYEDF